MTISFKKLVKTGEYLKEITEDLESYRIKKNIWDYDELKKQKESITVKKFSFMLDLGVKIGKVSNLLRKYKRLDSGDKNGYITI